METPLLIGIHGVKLSGKDTTAGFIEKWAGGRSFSVKRRGFADYAKLSWARQFYPKISMEDAIKFVDDYKLDENVRVVIENRFSPSKHIVELEFRQCLAQAATEGARNIYGEDHWADLLLPTGMVFNEYDLPEYPKWHSQFSDSWELDTHHGEALFHPADICVITDLRFENELKRIKQLGGIGVKIRRKEAEDAVIEEARRNGRDVHASELGIPDEQFNYIIVNDDNNLEHAFCRTNRMLDDIFAGRVKNNKPVVYA